MPFLLAHFGMHHIVHLFNTSAPAAACSCHEPCACSLSMLSSQDGHLELTHKGRAVYDSALPLEAAMQLYDSCRTADNGGSDCAEVPQ